MLPTPPCMLYVYYLHRYTIPRYPPILTYLPLTITPYVTYIPMKALRLLLTPYLPTNRDSHTLNATLCLFLLSSPLLPSITTFPSLSFSFIYDPLFNFYPSLSYPQLPPIPLCLFPLFMSLPFFLLFTTFSLSLYSIFSLSL